MSIALKTALKDNEGRAKDLLEAQQKTAALTLAHVENLETRIHQLEHDLAGFEDWDAHMAQMKAMRELIRDKIVNGDIWLNDTERIIFFGAGHVPKLEAYD